MARALDAADGARGTAARADNDDGLGPPVPVPGKGEHREAAERHEGEAEDEGQEECDAGIEMRQLERERERGKGKEPEGRHVGEAAQRLDRAKTEAGVEPRPGVAGDEQRDQGGQLQVHLRRLLLYRRRPRDVGDRSGERNHRGIASRQQHIPR
jgi:hypothetical protein